MIISYEEPARQMRIFYHYQKHTKIVVMPAGLEPFVFTHIVKKAAVWVKSLWKGALRTH